MREYLVTHVFASLHVFATLHTRAVFATYQPAALCVSLCTLNSKDGDIERQTAKTYDFATICSWLLDEAGHGTLSASLKSANGNK